MDDLLANGLSQVIGLDVDVVVRAGGVEFPCQPQTGPWQLR